MPSEYKLPEYKPNRLLAPQNVLKNVYKPRAYIRDFTVWEYLVWATLDPEYAPIWEHWFYEARILNIIQRSISYPKNFSSSQNKNIIIFSLFFNSNTSEYLYDIFQMEKNAKRFYILYTKLRKKVENCTKRQKFPMFCMTLCRKSWVWQVKGKIEKRFIKNRRNSHASQ